MHSEKDFWQLFGSPSDSVKKATIIIPVTHQQKNKFDSIANIYLTETPYDYAFFGMRCAAAAYDILSEAGIVENYAHKKTYRKNFYPKKFRKKLFALAEQKNWIILKQEGTEKRKWEKD